MIKLAETPIEPAAELRAFTAKSIGSGAIVSFTGVVRDHAGSENVSQLYLEAYSPLTENGIADIASQAMTRWDLDDCLIAHRTGTMLPGDPIVFVATASAHRRAAFQAADFIMDYLKTEAVFWKKRDDISRHQVDRATQRRLPGRCAMESTQQEQPKMSGSTEDTLIPVRIAVLTVSDTRTPETDTSGDLLAERILSAGHQLSDRAIVTDDVEKVRAQLQSWIDRDDVDVVISTGGTGLTGRDITPEAAGPLFDKTIDGFSVIFHQVSYESIGLSTLQSRALAGLANGTFVFCLPGSNGAVKDGWDKVISHQLDSRYRPCNLVEIMPRLMEA